VYLDGVFLARTIGANLNLLDIDRIEILKGPQGTLFGANTIGGAINVVTHTPGSMPSFVGTVTGDNTTGGTSASPPTSDYPQPAELDHRRDAEPDGLGEDHPLSDHLTLGCDTLRRGSGHRVPKGRLPDIRQLGGTGVTSIPRKMCGNIQNHRRAHHFGTNAANTRKSGTECTWIRSYLWWRCCFDTRYIARTRNS